MTHEDAADVGEYATQLFRYVTMAQKTAVAELMTQIRDVKGEGDQVLQAARDVGEGLLRAVAASAGEEQRLHVSQVGDAVRIHMRLHGYAPEDPVPNPWKSTVAAAQTAREQDDALYEWAMKLGDDEVSELTAAALDKLDEIAAEKGRASARGMYAKLDVRTSRTLRMLAWDHYQIAHAFD